MTSERYFETLVSLTNLNDKSTTLIIIDESIGELSRDFFLQSSRYVVLDADLLAKKRSMQKKTVAFLLKEARTLLTYAMKHGKILVVRMSDSKTDFLNTFCDECCENLEKESKYPPYQRLSYLPRNFLLKSGSLLAANEMISSLFHREDLQEIGGIENFEENVSAFKVIITTVIPHVKLEQQLINGSFGLPGGENDYLVKSLGK